MGIKMLVLSRQRFESIVIDGDIEITVLQIKGDVVRLEIKAPKDIAIMRGELMFEEPRGTIYRSMTRSDQ